LRRWTFCLLATLLKWYLKWKTLHELGVLWLLKAVYVKCSVFFLSMFSRFVNEKKKVLWRIHAFPGVKFMYVIFIQQILVSVVTKFIFLFQRFFSVFLHFILRGHLVRGNFVEIKMLHQFLVEKKMFLFFSNLCDKIWCRQTLRLALKSGFRLSFF
jgi:hypothetical protein